MTASSSNVCPEVTFSCSAVEFSQTTFRWFFNDDLFAAYPYSPNHQYPFTVPPENATYNALVGGVDVQILEASLNEDDSDIVTFLSTMTVNISALRGAGVSTVGCGRFSQRSSVNIAFNSSGG